MKWPRTTAIMAAALLSLAGCSNPVERGAPSSGDENPRGNTGDTPSSGESAEPGIPNGGSGDHFADYLPELGPSPTWHEGADFFDPCEDVPHHIYEQAGLLNPTPVDTIAESETACSFELNPDKWQTDNAGHVYFQISSFGVSPQQVANSVVKEHNSTTLSTGSVPSALVLQPVDPAALSCEIGFETNNGNVYLRLLSTSLSKNEKCRLLTDIYFEILN